MINVIENFDLTSHNTFAMKVKCEKFIEYNDVEDLPEIINRYGRYPILNIGEGSNLLFTGDYPGIVLHSGVKFIEPISDTKDFMIIRVGAGVRMDDFIRYCCESNLWGLENLSGIPGEVGASAVQNVGAYGVEACDNIVKVHTYDKEKNRMVDFDKDRCEFAYRNSYFKHPENKDRYIIHSVDFRLATVPTPILSYPSLQQMFKGCGNESLTPESLREAVINTRNNKLPDPSKVPSAGSFFKNPVIPAEHFRKICESEGDENIPHYPMGNDVKIPAAWLIEKCGWKGKIVGNVAVWHLQPLVIVNPERKATPDEVIGLENEIIISVKKRFDIDLTPEVEHITADINKIQ